MPNDDQPGGPPWTVLSLLQWTAGYFKRHGVDNPRADAEILLAHGLGCERIDLYLRHDQPLNEEELARIKPLLKRRVRREPVAYIVGYKEFWSLRFEVTPAVLIPRPDTECLVENALRHLRGDGADRSDRVLELGVGSGAVTVALAHECPRHRYWVSDRSWAAIWVARANARRHRVDGRIRFFLGHWLAPLAAHRAPFDMILSNPPYVRSGDIAGLAPEIREFEPLDALDGGPEGLDALGAIISTAHSHLRPGGLLLLEAGFEQRAAVEDLARQSGAYDRIVFHKDDAGHYRVARMQKKAG